MEPWTFYFVNGFLNFNVVFLFGVMSAVIWVLLHQNHTLVDNISCKASAFFKVTLAMTSRLFNIGSYSELHLQKLYNWHSTRRFLIL